MLPNCPYRLLDAGLVGWINPVREISQVKTFRPKPIQIGGVQETLIHPDWCGIPPGEIKHFGQAMLGECEENQVRLHHCFVELSA